MAEQEPSSLGAPVEMVDADTASDPLLPQSAARNANEERAMADFQASLDRLLTADRANDSDRRKNQAAAAEALNRYIQSLESDQRRPAASATASGDKEAASNDRQTRQRISEDEQVQQNTFNRLGVGAGGIRADTMESPVQAARTMLTVAANAKLASTRQQAETKAVAATLSKTVAHGDPAMALRAVTQRTQTSPLKALETR